LEIVIVILFVKEPRLHRIFGLLGKIGFEKYKAITSQETKKYG